MGEDSIVPEPVTAGERRKRALRLRCVVCGVGKPFRGLFHMNDSCEHCSYIFDRESGYFLGSIYINYGLCGAIGLAWAALATFVWRLSFFQQVFVPVILMVALSLWFFRYSRAFWMAFDLSWDPPTSKDFVSTGGRRPSAR